MSAETDIASAIGQCVSALAGVLGLGFIGWQIRAARKSSDLQALQAFLKDAKDHDAAILNGSTLEAKEQAFVEFLNFMEIYSTAVNDKLFAKSSRKMTVDKLIDSIVVIAESSAWHGRFEAAITSATTFSELRRFMARYRKRIESVRASRLAITSAG